MDNDKEFALPDSDRNYFRSWGDWLNATNGDLKRLHNLTTDQLSCLASSTDLLAVVESNRRVVGELKREAESTTKLTRAIVWLTVVLVVLTGALLWDAFRDKDRDVVVALDAIDKFIVQAKRDEITELKNIEAELQKLQGEPATKASPKK